MAKKNNNHSSGNTIRSRCGTCGEFATEGENHTCPKTGKTETHTNPTAPKPDPKDSK